jgi:hypothetical protein
MKHRNSHLLVGYWNRLRQGHAVPDQVAFDPRVIKRMLSSVIILDAENPSIPIYRLAGTEVCERFGFELRGTGFLAHWDAKSGARLPSLLRQALKLSQPICLSSIGASVAGVVELETVLAPVRLNGAEANRFVGAIQIFGDPTLLVGKPIAFQGLTESQLIFESDLVPAFDGPSAAPSSGPDGLRVHPRAPHLRLVASRPGSETVHFSDQSAQKIIANFDAGLLSVRRFRHETNR